MPDEDDGDDIDLRLKWVRLWGLGIIAIVIIDICWGKNSVAISGLWNAAKFLAGGLIVGKIALGLRNDGDIIGNFRITQKETPWTFYFIYLPLFITSSALIAASIYRLILVIFPAPPEIDSLQFLIDRINNQ